MQEKPRRLIDFDIVPKKTALFIIDMNYADAHPDYGLGLKMKELGWPADYYFDRIDTLVIPNLQKLLAVFRNHQLKVIYTQIGHELPDGSDMDRLRRKIYPSMGLDKSLPGTKDFEIRSEIAPQAGELCLCKRSSIAFTSIAMDQILKNMEVDTLVITGVVTDGCVYNNAVAAADRGYWVVVVSDATATFSEEMQEMFTTGIGSRVYFKVQTTQEVINDITNALRK